MNIRPESNPQTVTARPDPLALARRRLAARHLESDARAIESLMAEAGLDPTESAAAEALARRLVERLRATAKTTPAEAFLREYRLSSSEGVLLMCLAEALLRIPDGPTQSALIAETVTAGDWALHLGRSPSFLVNASTYGFLLSGRLGAERPMTASEADGGLVRLIGRLGEPVLRRAVLEGVRLLARQFVFGQTIEEALARARPLASQGVRFSFDMLGESARSMADAQRYAARYAAAIETTAALTSLATDVFAASGVSVKLSALHPRFVWSKRATLRAELLPRLVELAARARAHNLQFTIDAEEADRLELTLDIFAALARDPALASWNGLGLAVQAYQKRARSLIDWLVLLAAETGRRIPLRLVKGAYWDTEIKRAQEQGLDDYPVFTRKIATDTAYRACARAILAAPQHFYPQFASHNARTLADVATLAAGRPIEVQRLHGMGETVHRALRMESGENIAERVYAPVGGHEDLLAYLVRRLLENGANTSFVSQAGQSDVPIATLVADPVARLAATEPKAHPKLPPPPALFAPARQNARGLAFDNPQALSTFRAAVEAACQEAIEAAPLVQGAVATGERRAIVDPADGRRIVGHVVDAGGRTIEAALAAGAEAARGWSETGAPARAAILERAAALFEDQAPRLVACIVREAGRTLVNAHGEVREAVDFLRYYASEARRLAGSPIVLPGPTGEENTLALVGRGLMASISPWNFPLAIFVGQAAAALAAGNTVIAKPSEKTPLTGFLAVSLLHSAGVPGAVLGFLPGGGDVGAALVSDPRIEGVIFTGSMETARRINQALAQRPGPIVPFIAETGGVNALIADSTALPEQVVDDALAGAFDSAGQRCSATRLLLLQDDIAPRVIPLLEGAIALLALGDPMDPATDVGPVIDEAARDSLNAHLARIATKATPLASASLPPGTENGVFFAPRLIEVDQIERIDREAFGPILHVARFARGTLEAVCERINSLGYGLTLGLHTRLDATVETVRRRVRVGNLYVNRTQIGAVVGVQPFGGDRLSGTGPKAGGPFYLPRLMVERTRTINTTAAGGNASLLADTD